MDCRTVVARAAAAMGADWQARPYTLHGLKHVPACWMPRRFGAPGAGASAVDLSDARCGRILHAMETVDSRQKLVLLLGVGEPEGHGMSDLRVGGGGQ